MDARSDDIPALTVTDGLVTLGHVYAAGSHFRAVGADERQLGTFGCQGEARRAILQAARGQLLGEVRRAERDQAKRDQALARKVRARAAACGRAAS